MQVVEGAHQLDLIGKEHTVTEHVPGHVTDTHHGKQVLLGIDAQVAEVALDRLPGAPCGDPHFLVVVAIGATRGERIPQPVAILNGNCVGDVRESSGAFICGNH